MLNFLISGHHCITISSSFHHVDKCNMIKLMAKNILLEAFVSKSISKGVEQSIFFCLNIVAELQGLVIFTLLEVGIKKCLKLFSLTNN